MVAATSLVASTVQLLARPMSCSVRIPPSPAVLCFSVYDLLVAENVEKSTGGSTNGYQYYQWQQGILHTAKELPS